MPGARFISNLPINSHLLKAEFLMKSQAGRIWKRDASVGIEVALDPQKLKEHLVKLRGNSLPATGF